jgi:hypothetical protein
MVQSIRDELQKALSVGSWESPPIRVSVHDKSQREEYEEHYFDCADCAEDIIDAVAFMEGARQVFRD